MVLSDKLLKAREYEEKKRAEVPKEQRPAFHFSVPVGWMNDPNGFSMYNGEYHLFYQYYPYDTSWNSMHWGHAKSDDFVKWEYLPAALAPDQDYDGAGVFSGSALQEEEQQILMYTGVEEKKDADGRIQVRQTQCIAVGDGSDYQKLDCNPVITADQLPKGSSLVDFRDPKIWKEGQTYYAVVGSRHEDGSGQIALFSSENVRDWKLCRILDRCENQYGKMWECPDFFPLGEKQVLVVSPQDMQAEGLEFHNGNGTAFLSGIYEKETMDFHREAVQAVDYGLDFYAPQTMETEDGRRVMIAWMQSWDNQMCPEGFTWSGMMTVPRELSVRDGRICQNPVRELEKYRSNEVSFQKLCVENETELDGIGGRILDMTLEIAGGDYEQFVIKLAADNRYHSDIIYDRGKGMLTFDRTYSGWCRDVASSRSMYVKNDDGRLKLRILMDRYSVEIFVNDGEQAMTSLIYTPQSAGRIVFEARGKAEIDLVKYELVKYELMQE